MTSTPGTTAGEPDGSYAVRQDTVRRNAISAYLPLLVSLGLGFFLTPIFVRALSRENFGVWSIGLGLVSYLGIVDAGVGTAVATRVGHAVGNRDRIERISRTASAIYLAMGALCIVLGLGAAGLAPSALGIDADNGTQARVMIVLLAGWQAFNLLVIVPSGVLQGAGRYRAFALYGSLSGLGLGVAQALAAVISHQVAWVAGATLLGGVAAFAVTHLTARANAPGYVFSWRGADRRTARSLWRLGWRNSIIFIAGTAGYGSDILVVGFVLGARDAAIYAVASRAGGFVISLGTRATQSMTGSYATMSGLDQPGRIWSLYQRALQVSLLVYLPLAMSLAVFGHGLLVLWVGPIGAASYPVLLAVAASGLFQVAGQNAFTLIVATEQSDRILRLSLASCVLNIALSIYLTSVMGPSGAALGSAVTAALIDGIGLPVVASRLCGARIRSLLPVLASVLVPVAFAGVVAGTVRIVLGQSGPVAVFGSVVTVSAFLLGCVSTSTRRQDLSRLAGRIRP